ncbi:MAG TPA: hypothetical protein VHY08_00105, partial [Bacillota bacterium]|nr:hypothetical protein [Bacillota bacterium]
MDPDRTISTTVSGTEFLKDGIKFLWKQADDVIKLLVTQQSGKVKTKTAKIHPDHLPKFLEALPELEVDLEEAARKAGDLSILKKHLESYLDRGITASEAGKVKGYLDMLQSILEEVYHYKFRIKDPRYQNLIT